MKIEWLLTTVQAQELLMYVMAVKPETSRTDASTMRQIVLPRLERGPMALFGG
jgi:hypothetical protein